MRVGDLVRFREIVFHGDPTQYSDWKIGLLKEYRSWEKIATILYKGKDHRVRASLIQIHKQAKRT